MLVTDSVPGVRIAEEDAETISLAMEWGSVIQNCCCCCCWALASDEDADGDAFPPPTRPDRIGRPFVWVRRRPARLRCHDAAARPALIVVVNGSGVIAMPSRRQVLIPMKEVHGGVVVGLGDSIPKVMSFVVPEYCARGGGHGVASPFLYVQIL